jgi:YidC/Oxa1 family membrane protein insertase
LAGQQAPLARYRLALGRDTIALDTVVLRSEQRDVAGAQTLTYSGDVRGQAVRIGYTFVPDSFLVRVTGTVAGAPTGSALLVDLPRTLLSNEPDTLEDMGHLAVSYRQRGEVKSVGFSKLDTGEVRPEAGPLDWAATRNKYFLVAYRAAPGQAFSALRMTGLPRTDKVAGQIAATVSQPLRPDGTATFDIYAGPQDFERLQRLGGDLDQVNPYGGWFQGMVQPFSTIVMKALLWMKRTTQLNYGWVLVLFGVLVRLALWPLNQGAMRTSIKMQRLQPELQALQKKHSDDPKRQQEAIMKVYKDHGMSPLSPLMGCLPMLLPMPILFALYFVFQNTIEFRGVSFLWLPDISLKDPYYITPLLMGVSMFVMSWIGMKGAPPNPQAKMMTYMMPVMLTVVFLNFASGLNLYYAVQNIAALPQQWLLARERSQAPPVSVAAITPMPAVKRRS